LFASTSRALVIQIYSKWDDARPSAARGAVAEKESSLPGYAALLFLLHHVEFGLSLLQLFLLLLDFLQQLLPLLQQTFLGERDWKFYNKSSKCETKKWARGETINI